MLRSLQRPLRQAMKKPSYLFNGVTSTTMSRWPSESYHQSPVIHPAVLYEVRSNGFALHRRYRSLHHRRCSSSQPADTDRPRKRMSSHGTVAVIGAGSVGSTVCASLMQSGVARKILLVDVAEDLCRGQALDLGDGHFLTDSKVVQGTWADAAQAEIVVITAGVKQRPGETRNQLVDRNCVIFNDICLNLMPVSPLTKFIIVTNPVEVLAGLFQHISGLPHHRVVGSGTYLDSMRFREEIAEIIQIAPSSVHAYVIGEHGDSQIPLFSSARICGVPLLEFPGITKERLKEIAVTTMRRAYEIIKLKGSTYYGIATSVLRLSSSVLGDRRQVFCCSVYAPEYGTYLSLPCVLGAKGVVSILPLRGMMDQSEHETLAKVAADIKARTEPLKARFPSNSNA